jgi:hypothetical protein
MAGRRALLIGLYLLAVAGCEHFDSLRQGVLSTYSQELRRLGEDIDRKEMAKLTPKDGDDAVAEAPRAKPAAVQHVQWQAAPLSDAVQLGRPIPLSQASDR